MIARACVTVCWLLVSSSLGRAAVVPLPHAHAHNDYRHDPPLLAALGHGFTSVEADVFLVGQKLCVAHDADEIKPERTLRSLYLEPLRRRAKQNGGHVYATRSRFLLLVDLKSAAEPTYLRLHEILAEYRDVVTSFGPQGRREKAVLVIISGNRPLELMKSQTVRYAGCDGRLSDLESDLPADLMPLISDRWGAHFTWRGTGPMPAAEREKLDAVVRAAHAKGRLVRFWATPDARSATRQTLWRGLLSAGVDLINTDDLEGLKTFLLEHGR
ncbi:MAG: phosphatidylinositol-specific phospholipase C/glycerophosphodiester phosphodiesterase family protein [Sedimentisphaerales bacterium]|nr:phosphatidylinositol-specific phospholipase C/glycerophosphodiester phosphodiesterase family protein [Sedimentisphaerales bacterium]